jgi:hypothetical protein
LNRFVRNVRLADNLYLRLAFTWKKFRSWCTVGPLFTNLYFGQTSLGQTNRETQVPWIGHRRSVGGRGLRSCPVPYLNTEIKWNFVLERQVLQCQIWIGFGCTANCCFIPFYYLLADPTDVVLSNPNFSKLVCDDDLFSSIKFEFTMNLKVFYLHFDCKIDVQVNNPIAK